MAGKKEAGSVVVVGLTSELVDALFKSFTPEQDRDVRVLLQELTTRAESAEQQNAQLSNAVRDEAEKSANFQKQVAELSIEVEAGRQRLVSQDAALAEAKRDHATLVEELEALQVSSANQTAVTFEAEQDGSYRVLSPMRHNGQRYIAGSKIDLSYEEALPYIRSRTLARPETTL